MPERPFDNVTASRAGIGKFYVVQERRETDFEAP